METVRMMPSDPRYEYVNQLSHLIAIAKNPQVWFFGVDEFDNSMPIDVDDIKRGKIVEILEQKLEQLFNGADIETIQTDRDTDLIDLLTESEKLTVTDTSQETANSKTVALPTVYERFFKKLDKKLAKGENDIGPVILPEIFIRPVRKLENQLHQQYKTGARIDFTSDKTALGNI